MNAHVNHDLALALAGVSIDPLREAKREDHFAVNTAIKNATDAVQEQVESLYSPVLGLLDLVFGRLDEDLANFAIEKARLNAWVSAVSLVGAQSPEERADVLGSISDRASVMAKLILAPSPRRRLLWLLRRLEQMRPWWEVVTGRL